MICEKDFWGIMLSVKKLIKNLVVIMVVILSGSFVLVGCDDGVKEDVVRVHIRANSNSEFDQSVKLKVRDKVVEYITAKIELCEDSNAVKLVLNDNIKNIEKVANAVLEKYGCEYVSTASLDNEFFPSRNYDGISFPADYYDALIIRLGSGVGDNWWCVAYPPLCFVSNDSDRVVYKSKLLEIINKLFE